MWSYPVSSREALPVRAVRAFRREGQCVVMRALVCTCSCGDFEEVSEEEFDRVLGINVKGSFFAVQARGRTLESILSSDP